MPPDVLAPLGRHVIAALRLLKRAQQEVVRWRKRFARRALEDKVEETVVDALDDVVGELRPVEAVLPTVLLVAREDEMAALSQL